ncbi:hypothetical protein, partial [Mesorhizobium sp. M0276]|uniref:hypothetical protein n=1 Tax=Mesorhizobium sp. M0276 TaxID=2956928 RepID=UPI003334EEDE
MEIEEAREVRTTCPYCGVGCGVLAKVAPGGAMWGPRRPPPNRPIWAGWGTGVGAGATRAPWR